MFLYLSGIFLAFFLSFLLITKRNKTTADHILIAWLCITGLHLLSFYLFSSGQYAGYPTLIVLGFSLPLAQGPFLYAYTRCQTSLPPGFNKKQLLHFLPVILSNLLFARYYLMGPEQKTEVLIQAGRGFETQMSVNAYAVFISGTLYIALSVNRLFRYKKSIVHKFSNTEKINFNWLLYLIAWMVAIWITVLFVQDDRWVFACSSFFILWLGYFSIKQVQVFNQNPDRSEEENTLHKNMDSVKYQRSTLTNQDASVIHERLTQLMTDEKPFTNPDLTLNELAKTLEVHPNNLSQVINSRENSNFYDLVNKKRVEEFIQLTTQSANQQYTLLGIAYDCGFNSKASFNRNFKKYTGQTPSYFVKQQLTPQL